MATLSDVMTKNVQVVRPDNTVQDAARYMRDWDVGAIPVCDGNKLQGVITDRDIAVRVVASGDDPQEAKVSDAMSAGIIWCFDDSPVEEAVRVMQEHQVRRLPVIDHDKKLVGIVALADIAGASIGTQAKAAALEGVSQK